MTTSTESTNKFQNSLIDSAITEITEGSGKFTSIAKAVQRANGDNPLTRIANTLGSCRTEMRRLSALDESDNGSRVKQSNLKPGQMLGFIQSVMHKVCWQARRLHVANLQALEGEQANGIDFTQDIAEQVDVQPMTNEELSLSVSTDFTYLLNVHTWCAGRLGFSDVNDLYVYVIRRPIPEQELAPECKDMAPKYEIVESAMCFEEALPIMTKVIEQLRLEDEEKEVEEANNVDFTESSVAA